jgi:hypothetical protein
MDAAPKPPVTSRTGPRAWCGHLERSSIPSSGAARRDWGERGAPATQFSAADRVVHRLCTNITQHVHILFIAHVYKSWHISGLICCHPPTCFQSSQTTQADAGTRWQQATENPARGPTCAGFCRGAATLAGVRLRIGSENISGRRLPTCRKHRRRRPRRQSRVCSHSIRATVCPSTGVAGAGRTWTPSPRNSATTAEAPASLICSMTSGNAP